MNYTEEVKKCREQYPIEDVNDNSPLDLCYLVEYSKDGNESIRSIERNVERLRKYKLDRAEKYYKLVTKEFRNYE